MIDSGNDKESGRKINKILKEKNWKLKAIINTHSNADHIGGNNYLQRNVSCKIYSSKIENMFIESPELETAFLWGGLEVKELRNKFFQAKPSTVNKIIDEKSKIDNEIEVVNLRGHYFNMIGLRSADGVFFIADSLFGNDILEKYNIPFIFDVREYKNTIKKIIKIDSVYYVPSHGPVLRDIERLAAENLEKVEGIERVIIDILKEKCTFEKILQKICDFYKIELDPGQYALIGSTVRSFLSYLNDENRIEYKIEKNMMNWCRVADRQ